MAEPMSVVGERIKLTSPGVERVVYVPPTFNGLPIDVLDVLNRTKAVLREEEHWQKQTLFTNLNPDVDPHDPFCNSWQACLMGAAAMVTLGARREAFTATMEPDAVPEYSDWELVDDDHEVRLCDDLGVLYRDTIQALQRHLPIYEEPIRSYNLETDALEDTGEKARIDFGEVWEFNDHDRTTYPQIHETLDAAIAAEQER